MDSGKFVKIIIKKFFWKNNIPELYNYNTNF